MTNYHLDDDPRTYLYQKMAEHLAQRIAAGDLPPNTPLPAERRLAKSYGVSLGTARHATRILRSRGLVVTLRCKGTFIAQRDA
ncbi:winged helix-turn-helix domain-containing protein [Amycolatopsis pigmentata]|uniref:Winged helix-turn-helix domain-containing protein n=1 Tax=Amycolatopsis pigmentata TaxID=450801 RepID=A0ABW5FZE2_9PSEU